MADTVVGPAGIIGVDQVKNHNMILPLTENKAGDNLGLQEAHLLTNTDMSDVLDKPSLNVGPVGDFELHDLDQPQGELGRVIDQFQLQLKESPKNHPYHHRICPATPGITPSLSFLRLITS